MAADFHIATAPPHAAPPAWATEVLACPACRSPLSRQESSLRCARCETAGRWDAGIARFGVQDQDPSIAWYEAAGGTCFQDRAQIPYTMSSLDTPVYHSYLQRNQPGSSRDIVVDLGAGDGRNTLPWLAWGYERVVAVDAVVASLARLRTHLLHEHPDWLERVLLVQADVRRLPLASASVTLAVAVETLYYLNEDYALGLGECRRILREDGRLLTAERCWEGALLIHLLYGGVPALCQLADSRDVWDGPADRRVRSRCFTEKELRGELSRAGFEVLETKGVSVLSVVLGYLRGAGCLNAVDEKRQPQVRQCLQMLADRGALRKAHVILARPTRGGA